ncbi:MAG TPA: hypothetical protein VNR40_15175 [Steroidobacter sp.]|nr:hypothetical protein [Steroidobacter sp.]
MLRKSTFAAVLWLLAIALLPLRVANAHLHLCLDGQQQPVSLHVQETAGEASDEHTSEGHFDRDVDLAAANSAIAKLSGSVDDVSLAVINVYVLASLLPVQEHVAPRPVRLVSESADVFTFRPPVRGPPL